MLIPSSKTNLLNSKQTEQTSTLYPVEYFRKLTFQLEKNQRFKKKSTKFDRK